MHIIEILNKSVGCFRALEVLLEFSESLKETCISVCYTGKISIFRNMRVNYNLLKTSFKNYSTVVALHTVFITRLKFQWKGAYPINLTHGIIKYDIPFKSLNKAAEDCPCSCSPG